MVRLHKKASCYRCWCCCVVYYLGWQRGGKKRDVTAELASSSSSPPAAPPTDSSSGLPLLLLLLLNLLVGQVGKRPVAQCEGKGEKQRKALDCNKLKLKCTYDPTAQTLCRILRPCLSRELLLLHPSHHHLINFHLTINSFNAFGMGNH